MTSKPPKRKVLIVDDEALARARLTTYFDKYPDQYEYREAIDGVAALEIISVFQPHVILLDIEMPELSGFDVLRELGPTDEHRIIFQTAYDQFALKAFEASASDYLLKPYPDDRLAAALAKVFRDAPGSQKKLVEHLTREKKFFTQFVIQVGLKTRLIESSQVLCFTSDNHVTRIFLENVDYAYTHPLKYLEEKLDPNLFVRIHRNAIVRLGAIRSWTREAPVEVTLSNGMKIVASREGTRALKKSLDPDSI